MDQDKAAELLEATEWDYSLKNRLLLGLNVLAEHCGDTDIDIAAEHDVLYAGDFDSTVATMSVAEVELMSRCGWYYDEQLDCWAHNV